jgi:hypothetical protein
MEIKVLKPYQRLLRLFNVDKKEIYHIYLYSIFIGLTNLSLPLGIQAIINLVQLGTISATWIVLVLLRLCRFDFKSLFFLFVKMLLFSAEFFQILSKLRRQL